MNLDDSLTSAYETIREHASFDSHSLVPHPENLTFQATEERRAMHRLGTKLTEIVGNPDSEDLQYAAHVVKRHFWKELGLSQPPELATEVPRFLLKPDHKVEPRTDPQELASQLAVVPTPESSVLCIVSSKLALLQKLLNLPDVAIKFLTLAYANVTSLPIAPALWLPAALFIKVLQGLPVMGMFVSVDTLLQQSVADRFRGRVFGAYGAAVGLATLVGQVLASALGDHVNLVTMVDLVGLLYMGCGLLALALLHSYQLRAADPRPAAELA